MSCWCIISVCCVTSSFLQRHMFNHLQIHDHIDTVSEHIIQDHNWNQTSFKYLKLTHFQVYILKTLKTKSWFRNTIMLFPNLCLGFFDIKFHVIMSKIELIKFYVNEDKDVLKVKWPRNKSDHFLDYICNNECFVPAVNNSFKIVSVLE